MLAREITKSRPLRAVIGCIVVTFGALETRAQELPKHGQGEAMDFEPKLMLNDVPDTSAATELPAAISDANVQRLASDWERAKAAASRAQRLFKRGVFAKVEAERAALKVVRLESELAQARQRRAQQEIETLRQNGAGEEALRAAETSLATATEDAKKSATAWQEAQRLNAQLELQRERKLFAVGAGSNARVRKAEAALQKVAP